MKSTFLRVMLAWFGVLALCVQAEDYDGIKKQAESLYAEGSYAKAREVYQTVNTNELSATQQRWVTFRLADTLWRAQSATETPDASRYEQAKHDLEVLVRDITRVEDHDLVWAEVMESLGDFQWVRRDNQNWHLAWPYYQKVLDYWAGAPDVKMARQRYLNLVWKALMPPNMKPAYYSYGMYGNFLPKDILENVLLIAESPEDQARAHYYLAMTLQGGNTDWAQMRRVSKEFEEALAFGKKTEWYGNALYQYALWLSDHGKAKKMKDGSWGLEPDYPKALEFYQRLISEYKQGECPFYEQAKLRIQQITESQVGVRVQSAFLPDSEVQFDLNWRNTGKVDLTVYSIDLTKAPRFKGDESHVFNWIQHVSLDGAKKERSWSFETRDDGSHIPGNKSIHLDEKMAPGAYILEAKAGDKSARDLILVSDVTVVLNVSGKQALVYVCNVLSGAPVADGQVHFWERYQEGNLCLTKELSKSANADGIAVFETTGHYGAQFFISAVVKDRQAFTIANPFFQGLGEDLNYKIYVTTDRPAYRPKETVQWKMVVRRNNGSVYATPAQEVIEYEISDPQGGKVQAGKVKLNEFGSAWGGFDLGESVPLGMYRIQFWDEGRKNSVGSADLFRTEEYKLPEFKVTVKSPTEKGRPKVFRLGDKVQVDIAAEYYFGGGVDNATVEVVVYQEGYSHTWNTKRDYPWFYDADMSFIPGMRPMPRASGQVVKRDSLKTGADGHVLFAFDTPAGGSEMEYRVEARVVDSSRREVVGNGVVRVTRQSYYVNATPAHYIHHPNEKVEIKIQAADANDLPVQAEGTVKVTREVWREIWIDPKGAEVKDGELRRRFPVGALFPPPAQPGELPWHPKFQGYESEEIQLQTVKTGTNGLASITFTPEKEGYYKVVWHSEDRSAQDGPPDAVVRAESMVWVAKQSTSELGYHHDGIQIIADADTFRVGQKAPVLLSVSSSDRYVLFFAQATDLYSYQLVHVSGDVKLVELPIEEKHTPNFYLSACMISDRQLYQDTKEIVVPPLKNFLTVTVSSDRDEYLPRSEGVLTVETKDSDGKPVSSEVSMGVADDSVYAIQQDLSDDPRQFYFGRKRSDNSSINSTCQYLRYDRFVLNKKKQVVNERDVTAVYGESQEDKVIPEKTSSAIPGSSAVYSDEDSSYTAVGGMAGGREALDMMVMPKSVESPVMLTRASRSSFRPAKMSRDEETETEAVVTVRSDFRSTLFWQPDVKTDSNGRATVKVKYPDSVTSWRAMARAITTGNQFGIATNMTQTRQPLIVRLQAPRFFLVGDVLNVSAVINNNTDAPLDVSAKLDVEGLVVSGLYVSTNGVVKGERADKVLVSARGETRVDWAVTVLNPGTARLKVTARGGGFADAMERSYAVYEHGIEKLIAKSGKLRGDSVRVLLDIPKERKSGTTEFSVQVTPSLAVTMLDALPYLIDYPYGCTEQTMSRFLPVTITAKTLNGLGLAPEDVVGRAFGGIETNSANVTHPDGRKSLDKLHDMERQSLERLYDFQHADGGWGWWKEGESDRFMTAYVIWGMALARDSDISVKPEVLQKAVAYLSRSLVEEESNYDVQAWMLHALTCENGKPTRAGDFKVGALENLWKHKDGLNSYSRALLALSAKYMGDTNKARILVENLENGVVKDMSPDTSVIMQAVQQADPATTGTAHWGQDGISWRWSDGGVEATAFALRAILAVDPKNPLVEPTVNWLIKNRRGAQWSNTRDTSIVILALNDYLKASGELTNDAEFEIRVNGQSLASHKVTPESVIAAPCRFVVNASQIRDGTNEVEILRRGGKGPLYFAASARFFSLEEPIKPAGNELFVRRQYYKLVGRPSLLKGIIYEKQPLNEGDSIRSGERVETVVTLESKNNYEYLLFEDLKPAGFEAVDLQSGSSLYARELRSDAVNRKFANTNAPASPEKKETGKAMAKLRRPISGRVNTPTPSVDDDHTGRARWVYQELRDRKVAMFIDKLPQGVWEIRYTLRAETPGQFHALPVLGEAMYAPEIRCNSLETRIQVLEAIENK